MKMATRSFITNSFKSVKTPKGKDKKEPTNGILKAEFIYIHNIDNYKNQRHIKNDRPL